MYHNILIVCLGNICRSPMAEYVLRHRARRADYAEKTTRPPHQQRRHKSTGR